VRPVEPYVESEIAGVGGGLGVHRLDEPFDGVVLARLLGPVACDFQRQAGRARDGRGRWPC
jgi:hypothetical protein